MGDIYLQPQDGAQRRRGRGARRQGRHRPELRRGIRQPAAGRSRRACLRKRMIDQALRRLLTARFRLGMFDPPAMVKYAQIPYSVNDSAGAPPAGAGDRAQIHRAAEESKAGRCR